MICGSATPEVLDRTGVALPFAQRVGRSRGTADLPAGREI